MNGKLLLGGKVDEAVRALRLDLEMTELVPLEIEFVLKGFVALSAGEIRVLLHVQREVRFQREFLLAVIAVETGSVAILTEVVSAVDIGCS